MKIMGKHTKSIISELYAANLRKYSGWLHCLKLLGIKYFGWDDTTQPSPEHWKHFFDDGVHPLDALRIDLTE